MRVALVLLLCACHPSRDDGPPRDTRPQDSVRRETGDTGAARFADVVAVAWTGSEGAWTFTVTLRSPDVDCKQYADWWELVSPEGQLVYRRILDHSHPDEQPFARSGDPVDVAQDQALVVRGHMNGAGYGGVAFTGSMASGFAADPAITATFAAALAEQEPQPEDCLF